jgi:abortive infection bacteriophage resistance protein
MANKVPNSMAAQIALLKQRGMLFKAEASAHHFLENISYYRLKGYWWDMQADYTLNTLKPNTYFEDVLDRYTFDRHLRLILFATHCHMFTASNRRPALIF